MKQQFKTLAFTVKMVFLIDKNLFFVIAFFTIITGVAPIISLQITQNVLNNIQSMILPFNEVIKWIILYGVFTVFIMIIQNVSSHFITKFNIILTHKMKYELMKKCSELSLESLETTEIYDMISRLENEVETKPFQSLMAITGIFSSFGSLFLSGFIMFEWQPKLFLLIILISIIHCLGRLKITKKEFQMRFNRSDKERELWYYSFLLMKDTAFKEVKVLNLKDYFLNRYLTLVNIFIEDENNINKLGTFLNIVMAFIQDFMSFIVMFIAIREAYLGTILIGTALVYMSITGIIQRSTQTLANDIHLIYDSNLYMNLLNEFLNLEEHEKFGSFKIDGIKSIKVTQLSYNYPNQQEAIKNLNFEISKGERVAIVGENGSGKSTLLKLLCGLYQPTLGNIMINEKKLSEISLNSYRKKISVLFQDFLKFEGSLLENVHIGFVEKNLQKESIKEALELAQVNFLKDGHEYLYERYLGNWFKGGSQLSGGQWQKIALARAYYKNAAVYFLDEPSSALDVNAEIKIFKSFFQKSENNIGIFITHRVKIAKQAEKIIVMEKGEIVGIGNHQFLYENCKLYKDLLLKEQELNILENEETIE